MVQVHLGPPPYRKRLEITLKVQVFGVARIDVQPAACPRLGVGLKGRAVCFGS